MSPKTCVFFQNSFHSQLTMVSPAEKEVHFYANPYSYAMPKNLFKQKTHEVVDLSNSHVFQIYLETTPQPTSNSDHQDTRIPTFLVGNPNLNLHL